MVTLSGLQEAQYGSQPAEAGPARQEMSTASAMNTVIE
jgi:hypothetical protein